jgi:thiol-disulfide isomerase/thioredoxin
MNTPPRVLTRAAAVAVGLATVLLAGCTGGKNAVDQSAGGQFRYVAATKLGTVIPPSNRKKAGDVSGELLAGGTYRLNQDTGKVVVLNFLASWCGPCQIETPNYDQIYRVRKADGVQFVGLDVKDASRSASESWVADKKISFPMVYDESAKTALQLGNVPIVGLPATVLIDKQGKVAAVYTGALAPKDITPVLDTLTAES